MKKITIITLLATALLTSCKDGGGTDPDPAQAQLEKLSKTWTTVSVTFGGSEDRTTDWSAFTLTATAAKTYTTTNAFSPGPWPASGSFDFAMNGDQADINKLVRNDGLEIGITVTETDLTMTFTYDDTAHSGGRTEIVNGQYVFKMKAQ